MQNKKEYWYISYKGDLSLDIDKNKYKDRFRKQIGNYFKSVHDADKYLTILVSKKELSIKLLFCLVHNTKIL